MTGPIRLPGQDHRPDGNWRCRWCPKPWPCKTARISLLAAHTVDGQIQWTSLFMTLGLHLIDACREAGETSAGDLCRQIVGWARVERRRRAVVQR